MKQNKKLSGFTLIEILIVVAIIAILASVVLVGLGPTQQAGRDARRISDLHEVQNGLELYNGKCGYYPGAANCDVTATTGYNAGATNMVVALTTSGIGATQIPQDPTNNSLYKYLYATNGASATTYVLEARLENASGSVFTGYSAPSNMGLVGSAGDTLLGSCAAPYYCIAL